MSFYFSPRLVNRGLILALDVKSTSSYPGTGQTWYDLTSNINHAGLINGPTYDSQGQGNILFDGFNDYAKLSNQNFYNIGNPSFTLLFFVKANSTTPGRLYGEGGVSLDYSTVGRILFGCDVTGKITLGLGSYSVTDGTIFPSPNLTLDVGQWNQIGVTNQGSVTKFYKNGQLWSSYTHFEQTAYPIIQDSAYIGKSYQNAGEYFNGNIATTHIYNRALTDLEILQNYNFLKYRFGLT